MPETKLKPCPFCGSAVNTFVRTEDGFIILEIKCSKCRNTMEDRSPLYNFEKIKADMDLISKRWNRRANEDG